jgi:hypothetical protein
MEVTRHGERDGAGKGDEDNGGERGAIGAMPTEAESDE